MVEHITPAHVYVPCMSSKSGVIVISSIHKISNPSFPKVKLRRKTNDQNIPN